MHKVGEIKKQIIDGNLSTAYRLLWPAPKAEGMRLAVVAAGLLIERYPREHATFLALLEEKASQCYALHPPITGDALPDLDFCGDTAGSWEGRFPFLGLGDYLVADAGYVLVSRRYTSAVDGCKRPRSRLLHSKNVGEVLRRMS
jgi:hypothetical protein